MKKKYEISGMTCSACSSRIEKNVKKMEGVNEVIVNLLTNSMQVEFDDKVVSDQDIIAKVVKSGYGASLEKEKVVEKNLVEDELASMKFRLIVSFVFLIPLFYLSMGPMMGLPVPSIFVGHENALTFAFTLMLLCLPILYVNRKYFIVGFKALGNRSPNMDSLIAIGSTASFLYGVYAIYMIGYGLGHGDMELVNKFHMDLYFESAGMILALITLGKYLETRSKGKTSEAIQKLIDLTPKSALLVKDGIETEVLVENLQVGDLIRLKPGNRVPVDGVIVEGTSSFDESSITGESIPVSKQVGDTITCATINTEGSVLFKASRVGNDTTLATMIALVEEASSSKAPIAKLADKISGVFVPVVIAISIVSFIVWMMMGYNFEFALNIAISVLVISCPCALGLATPVAIMVATGKGAQNGILIKSGEALETAHNITAVILDKTGTITQGSPKVVDIMGEDDLLQIAMSIESNSEHPLAKAIMEEGKKQNLELLPVSDFEAVFGRGVKGIIAGHHILGGNVAFMLENQIQIDENKINELASNGLTPLLFASDSQFIGMITVADQIKPTSNEAIAKFKQMGIHTVMLTGDQLATALAIQKQCGVDEVIAQVLPTDKANHIKQYQQKGYKVAMIGDGVNDALALTTADVGIAIGAGSDIAIESADVVLMRSDLMDATSAIQLSKSTITNIKENLFWAFFYNTIGIPLAAGLLFIPFGLKLNPMFAAAAMSLSSVSVVLNALRLKRFKIKK